MPRVSEILTREGFRFHLAFENGRSTRWVNLEKYVRTRLGYLGPSPRAHIQSFARLSIDGGLIILGKHQISGDTLFSMGHTDNQNIL